MNVKIAKIISIAAMAAALSCTSVSAYAQGDVDTEPMSGAEIDGSVNWDIGDYADNIKSAYSEKYPEQAEIINEIVDGYLSDNEFIGVFEREGGSAFLIVEETIHDVLDPQTKPIIQTDDLYTSKYNIPLIKQRAGCSDGASAAVLMALYGCGAYAYTNSDSVNNVRQDDIIDRMYFSNEKTTIGEVTRALRNNFSGSGGYTFQTQVYISYNNIFNALANSLIEDASPIIRVTNSGTPYYAVVREIDFNAESVTLIDARYGTVHVYSYNAFETLATSGGSLWMSVYVRDKTGQGINELNKEYPKNSFFTKTGGQCTNHGDFDHPTLNTCNNFDRGWQCAGYAQYAFYKIKGRLFSSSLNETNVTGFGKYDKGKELDNSSAYEGKELNASEAKEYLQGLPTGAYVRIRTKWKDKNGEYVCHSFTIISTSSTEISLYQANFDYNNPCMVTHDTYTWSNFIEEFNSPTLLFIVD